LFISLNYLAFIFLINMSDMENITISTSEFALGDIPDINEVNEVISSVNSEDYLKYIYIAIAIIVAVLAFLIYKYYVNREKKVTFQDKLDNCYGDVCYR